MVRPNRPSPQKVLKSLSAASGITEKELLNRKFSQDGFRAAVYLLRRASNLPLKEVARMGNVSESRISQIQKAIDDKGGISAACPWGKSLTKLL